MLMLKCWERDADDRPCFKDIVEEIGEAASKQHEDKTIHVYDEH